LAKLSKKPVSHDAGGPSASRGPAYQTYFAIHKALELTLRHYAAPHKAFSITIEPRIVHPDSKAVTAWDIFIDHEAIAWEAKVNATKQDLIEWLRRVESTGEAGVNTRFGFVYGQTNTPLLAALGRFHRVALECEGDDAKFDALAGDDEPLGVISSNLGPHFRDHLRRMEFLPAPEMLLKSAVEDRAIYLAGSDSSRLVDFLFRRFSEGAVQRRRYLISDLLERVHQESIEITPPRSLVFAEVPPNARNAIAALGQCPAGLPFGAVAAMFVIDGVALVAELNELLVRGLIVRDRDILRAAVWHPEQAPPPQLAADWLDPLLSWLSNHEADPSAGLVARGALNLARIAFRHRPGLSLKLFQASEHVVKNMGDKHLLLEISELCIHTGSDSSTVDRDLRAMAKAQAMLCGHSWVFQRTGRLSEARTWAEKSEQLGEAIGWDRNTAFSKKCVARIDRVEAERTADPHRRLLLLTDSETKLRAAIGIFSGLSDFQQRERQVGDCYSLLARTQFVAGDLDGAARTLRKANEFLLPAFTKEYFDLLILIGEVEAKNGPPASAESHYTSVI
jgi:hypothetical protein